MRVRTDSNLGWYKYTYKWNYSKGSGGITIMQPPQPTGQKFLGKTRPALAWIRSEPQIDLLNAPPLTRDGMANRWPVSTCDCWPREVSTRCDTCLPHSRRHLPVVQDWRLNERMYGALQGLDKTETVEKHGAEQVLVWRRSYATPPPVMDKDHEFNPRKEKKYDFLSDAELPQTESLACVVKRFMPLWNDVSSHFLPIPLLIHPPVLPPSLPLFLPPLFPPPSQMPMFLPPRPHCTALK